MFTIPGLAADYPWQVPQAKELYTWQTDGPSRYDYMGRPAGERRDAGALELQ